MAVRANDTSPRYRAAQHCAREAPGGVHPRRVQASGTYEGSGAFNESNSENTFTDHGTAFASDPDYERDMERYYRVAMDQNYSAGWAPRFERPVERGDARSSEIDKWLWWGFVIVTYVTVARASYYAIGIASGAY